MVLVAREVDNVRGKKETRLTPRRCVKRFLISPIMLHMLEMDKVARGASYTLSYDSLLESTHIREWQNSITFGTCLTLVVVNLDPNIGSGGSGCTPSYSTCFIDRANDGISERHTKFEPLLVVMQDVIWEEDARLMHEGTILKGIRALASCATSLTRPWYHWLSTIYEIIFYLFIHVEIDYVRRIRVKRFIL